MVTKVKEMPSLKVIKRDGKKVDFLGTKIAVAIKKGFDATNNEAYTEESVNKVYRKVLDKIEKNYSDEKFIKIEDIQDMIEDSLRNMEFQDVLESFSSYRERRNESRRVFFSRQHKLAKAIELLSLKEAKEEDSKRENGNIDGNTAMGTMLQYGSTISKEFAKSYLMNKKFSEAHDSGEIHIHDMDFLPMGTTTCCQIDLTELFKDGF